MIIKNKYQEENKMRKNNNILITKLGVLVPVNRGGLPHFGGKQYFHVNEKGDFNGNLNLEELGKCIFNLSDEDLKKLIDVENKYQEENNEKNNYRFL